MVLAWSVNGLYMVLAWSVHGLYMAFAWSVHGLRMVCTWFLHSLYMVCVWYVLVHGSCNVCALCMAYRQTWSFLARSVHCLGHISHIALARSLYGLFLVFTRSCMAY